MGKNGKLLITAGGAALALAVTGLAPATAGGGHHDYDKLRKVTVLDSPRGVDALGHGKTLVTEGDGTFSLVIERKHKSAKVVELGSIGGGFAAPAIAAGKHGTIWLLTVGGPPPNGSTLFKWRPGWDDPRPVRNIADYQAGDPDPFDQEGEPTTSNPFGLAALKDGTVLVADAEGNDLLRVWPNGRTKTVARLMPRLVKVPQGLPDIPPPDGPLPPAGTPILAESVATSVTVGPDGYWYVGELRGFPATPKTSQIWRIKPGTTNAKCNPKKPWRGPCKRYSDGLTSIVDLGSTHKGILAVSLSKKSWFQMELGVPGADTGGLFHVTKRHHGGPRIKELVRNRLTLPSGVDGSGKSIYLTAPFFGPGALWKIS